MLSFVWGKHMYTSSDTKTPSRAQGCQAVPGVFFRGRGVRGGDSIS